MAQQLKELNIIRTFDLSMLEECRPISFMNFASLTSFFRGETDCEGISYCCDGMLMSLLVSVLTGSKIERMSFDFTSIADEVLRYAVRNGRAIYVVGGTADHVRAFVDKVARRYSNLSIVGYHHGYFRKEESDAVLDDILRSGAGIVIVGLGAGLQESFMGALQARGFKGISFSCGGFIRQEASSTGSYYPRMVDTLHLRAFYRMYVEPHTIRRYLFRYPVNAAKLVALTALKRVVITLR